GVGVGRAGPLGARRVGDQPGLGLGYRDVLPAPDDEILGPAGDADRPARPEAGQVAGVEPAGFDALGEGGGVEVGAAVVGEVLGRRADQQPPLAAGGHITTVAVDDAQLHPVDRRAVGGADGLVGVVPWRLPPPL